MWPKTWGRGDERLWRRPPCAAHHGGVDVDDLDLVQVRRLLDQLAHQRLLRPLASEVEGRYRQLCEREAELLQRAS